MYPRIFELVDKKQMKELLENHFDIINGLIHCSGGGQTKCLKFVPDNVRIVKDNLFKPYTNLCEMIGNVILECNPKYKYPKSLSSTIIEMAHFQNYFMNNLPSLTDFGGSKDETKIISFLEDLVFSNLKKG